MKITELKPLSKYEKSCRFILFREVYGNIKR